MEIEEMVSLENHLSTGEQSGHRTAN